MKSLLISSLLLVTLCGCANFRRLGENLAFMSETYVVSAYLTNAAEFDRVRGIVIEWDAQGVVRSGDVCDVGDVGLFGFIVREAQQHIMAYSDANGNNRYDLGEPCWIHTDDAGNAVPVAMDAERRRARAFGKLSRNQRLPQELLEASQRFVDEHGSVDAAKTGLAIPVALGEIADLDRDERFAAVRGSDGMWEPVRFLENQIGIYFLEPYDPKRIPVLFVYGAAGSPQDWRSFFDGIDRSKYQPWFYFFPSGSALDRLSGSLNYGVRVLQHHYGFEKMHVVAHSMGGLISRGFLMKNILRDGQNYIDTFVTISTPWGGHKAAEMGVKRAPEVVPSWRDMQPGSDYQREVFSKSLRGRVDHLLLYGTKSSRSLILPDENDGTVSVASQRAPAAISEATIVQGFEADHVGILSRPDVMQMVWRFLDGERW